MKIDTFRQMYITELQELRSVADQLVEALPKLAAAASHRKLKEAIQGHLEKTRLQRDRLDETLRRHGVERREHVDQSMQTMIRESEKWASMVQSPELRDAGLIASAQRVEHYEIAVYGTLATWAKQIGLEDDLRVLHGILDEEKQADAKLSMLAKQIVNPDAAAAAA